MFLAMQGLTRPAQAAGRVLDCSAGIRLANIFRQQQAKNHKESCGQNIGDSLQDKAEQVQCTIKQYNIFGKHKQSIKLFIIFYVSDQNNLLFISFMIFMLHVTNVSTRPNDKASWAIHMASSLLDI